MTDVAVALESVAKEFAHYTSPLRRLQEAFSPTRRKHHVPIPVLHDVTFTVPRGQTVAVIGPNGVGKSTLLHLIAGLIQPDAGTVAVNGNVRALLELGGSFLPDLTGRENARFFHEVVFKNDGRWPEHERDIEAFADIGEFFDRPVRTYSTGMFLRLAFASATAIDPDILLIDEVLAVGDARFQLKCYHRIRELRERGATILLVTHNVDGLPALCDRVIVLDHGRIVFDGDPGGGVSRYYQLFFTAPLLSMDEAATAEHRFGHGGAVIANPFASRDGVQLENAFATGERVRIVMDVQFERAVAAPHFGIGCTTREGVRIYATATNIGGPAPAAAAAGETRRVEIALDLDLTIHDVFIDLSVFELVDGSVSVLDARMGVLHLVINSPRLSWGITDLRGTIHS